MATKKSNKQLWIMLALIAVIIAAILLLPSCGSRGGKEKDRQRENRQYDDGCVHWYGYGEHDIPDGQ